MVCYELKFLCGLEDLKMGEETSDDLNLDRPRIAKKSDENIEKLERLFAILYE